MIKVDSNIFNNKSTQMILKLQFYKHPLMFFFGKACVIITHWQQKVHFYCVNTSYPMDNCFTGRHNRSCQTPEKDILYIILARLVSNVHSLGGASYLANSSVGLKKLDDKW